MVQNAESLASKMLVLRPSQEFTGEVKHEQHVSIADGLEKGLVLMQVPGVDVQ